jgi:hypothetical protein
MLPELPIVTLERGAVPVQIRLGKAPAALSSASASTPSFEANQTEFLLRLPGVATYYARDGAEIVVDPATGAPELDVRSYLMGSIFSAICHQRGLLPLHASAIATPQGAAAFLGASGAGKSSMAAFLARRGHRVLADDICVMDPAAPREQRVLPVAPWLKLWSATLDAMGESTDGLPRVFVEDQKYRYTLAQPDGPTALVELILLERDDSLTAPVFERLTPVQAVQAVLDYTYQSWLVRAIGRTEHYFQLCGQALEGVRVTRMSRSWGFHAMESALVALEEHLASRG